MINDLGKTQKNISKIMIHGIQFDYFRKKSVQFDYRIKSLEAKKLIRSLDVFLILSDL